MNDILTKIKSEYQNFSKGQKRIADFILNHYEKAAYMTASKLGVSTDVSESTVVRFASELGYDGYPKFQKELLANVKTKLNSIERIHVSNERVEYSNTLNYVLESDIEQIKQTLLEIDHNEFENIVNELIKAEKIYILGVRSSASLATFLGFYFNLLFDNISVINSASSSEIFEQMIRAKQGDVFIGVSFPRYSTRTVNAMKYAREHNVKTIALTDALTSPLCENADYKLIAKSDMSGLADSLVSPLSVINALITCISRKKSKETEEVLNDLEKIWKKHRVYSEDL